ncbi:unnamed protein product, partial [Brassica napus]
MKIDRFLRRRLIYLLVVGAVEWSISSSSVPWRSPTEMMFGDDLDSSKFSSSSVHAISVKVRLTLFCCSHSYLIDLVGFGSSLTFAYIEREVEHAWRSQEHTCFSVCYIAKPSLKLDV